MAELKEQYGEDKQRLQHGDDGALQAREGEPGRRLPADPGADPGLPTRSTRCSTVTIDMRQAPFFGWIHDLSVPDPTTILNLFGLHALGPADLYLTCPIVGGILRLLSIGVWPLDHGLHHVGADAPQPDAAGSRAGEDVRADAVHLHLHAGARCRPVW